MLDTPQFTSARALFAHYRAVSQRLAETGLPLVPDAPPLVPEPEPVQVIASEPAPPTTEQRIAETVLLARKLFAAYPMLSKVALVRKAASRCFEVSEADLRSPCRKPCFTVPRQLAVTVAQAITKKSLSEIGWHFGGRDHSTIHHAVAKYRSLIAGVIAELGEMQ